MVAGLLPAAEMLAPGGALAGLLAGYENRPTQRQMAQAVAGALADERALLVEAGTGTGKTLAYLVPALASGKRVVISTGTKALQEQLASKDVTLLSAMARSGVRAAVLKGTSNYVCRRRLAREEIVSGADAADELVTVRGWIGRSDVGDRAELTSLSENSPIWQRITTSADGRLGAKCPYIEHCFVAKARKRAERAELVIVNHHLFFADFALRRRGFGARVLPDFDAVIFDEAHQLEDIIATHLGPNISSRAIASLCAELEEHDESWIEKRLLEWLLRCSADFFAAIAARVPDLSSGRSDIPEHLFAESAVRDAWLKLDTALDDVARSACLRADRELINDDATAALQAAAMRAEQLRDAAAEIAEPNEPPCGQWIESTSAGIVLCAAPGSAAKIVAEVLDETPAAIFTSATLTTEGSFSFIRSRLGLEEQTAESIALASPFDYESQALLYVPRDLPGPSEPGFLPAAAIRIAELLEFSGGGAFVLFTSWKSLNAVAAQLRQSGTRQLLVQGEAPKSSLIETFRREGDAVLLATSSFWEGVDVAGDALRSVIIEKLPFVVPTDPLHKARMKRIEEAGGDPFASYQLPAAALSLKQGFGRLIRSRQDRGTVTILDKRLVTRRYGRSFFDTLPLGLKRTSAIEQVRRFWMARGDQTP